MAIQLRAVRSFVRRQGRMLASQKSAFEHYWSDYGLELNRHKLNPDQMFCRQAPLVIEIGFGMGHSLLQMAEQNPAINYIGIEVHRPGVGALLQGIAEKGLANLRIYCADAVEILQQAIADESLTGVQVFFPDPWHKRRHHKRRLIQAEFLQLVQRKLKLGGFIHIATDWHDYAEQALHLLEQNDGFSNASIKGSYVPRPNNRPLTKYEQRAQRLGHGVWDIVFIKV